MSITYVINEGVRRAKAADLAGRKTIWAHVGTSMKEQKIELQWLLSPKKTIDVGSPRELARWQSIKAGMTQEPDLFPPIHVIPGSYGTPIARVRVVGEPV
jgi:hypothetical protein